jgi:hypothetical protein
MPQSTSSNLAVAKGGTVIHQVATIALSGSGVTLTADPNNPHNADVTIVSGGSPTLAAHSLFGNPGTASGVGTNVAIGSNLTLTPGGTLNASAGGGGGPTAAGLGIDPTQFVAGTVANTGTMVLPDVTNAAGYGVTLKGSHVLNSGTGGINNTSLYFNGGSQTLTSSGFGAAGGVTLQAGALFDNAGSYMGGAYGTAGGGYIDSSGNKGGGDWHINAGASYGTSTATSQGGIVSIKSGYGKSIAGVISLIPGVNAAGTFAGVQLLHLPKSDPHTLSNTFLTSVSAVGYVFVQSQG